MKPKIICHTFYFNSAYLGKTLDSLPQGRRCQLLGLIRGDAILLAQGRPVIEEGDCLLAIAFDDRVVPAFKLALSRWQGSSDSHLSLSAALF